MKKESTKVFEDNSACIAQLEKVISIVTRQSIFPQYFSHTYESLRKINKWTSNMYVHATIRKICL